MKAITLWEPYATAIALGYKRYETRTWKTSYRGNIAIHASKKKSNELRGVLLELQTDFPESFGHLNYDDLPFGCVIAACRLIECHYTTTDIDDLNLSEMEWHLGNFLPKRYAWELELVKLPETPIPATGKQGVWDWHYDG